MGDPATHPVEELLELTADDLPNVHYRHSHAYMSMGPQYVPNRGLVRYSQALKHLIPIRKKNRKENVLGIDKAGLFSIVTYSWMSKYIWQAYKEGLTPEDIPRGSSFDAADVNARRLELLWQNELSKKGPDRASFGVAVWQFARTRLLIACVAFSFSCIFGFLSPTIFMRKLLEYCEDPKGSFLDGAIWAAALTCSELLRTIFFCLCWSISYRTATRLRAACLALVYRKLISLHSLGTKSAGEVINLFANDGTRLFYMVVFGPMIVGGPMVAICGIVYILTILGPWALFGMLTFILFYPLQYVLSRLTGYYRARTIRITDQRVKLMTELLNSIKLIKMYAWERAFSLSVDAARNKELSEIRKTIYCQSLSITMAPTVPVISGIVTFAAHVLAGGNLTASQTFSVLAFTTKFIQMALRIVKDALFAVQEGIIRFPHFKAFPLLTIVTAQLRGALLNLRYGTENLIVGALSFSRAQDVLMMETKSATVQPPKDPETALQIVEGTFIVDAALPKPMPPPSLLRRLKKRNSPTDEQIGLNAPAVKPESVELLTEISLCVTKGKLIGVCGIVGSGKTSLLLACLGQLKMESGDLYRTGSVAYVSQQAWIQNATLKENIIFGSAFNAKRYINTLYCCALNDDVHLLPGGDETEIGERGVNLSGGQKQRVALARALYAERDIYLLDDPLSAVDAQVASHIFDQALIGTLKRRSVVLVTHQVAHLQRCDTVLVMKNGRIVANGHHEHLLSTSTDYSVIVQAAEFSTVNLSNELGSTLNLSQSSQNRPEPEPAKQCVPQGTVPEEQVKGEVQSYAYLAYLQAAGGYFVSTLAVAAIFINTGANAFSSYWLAEWIRQGSGNATILDPTTNDTVISSNIADNPDLSYYMSVYVGIIGIIILTSIARSVIFAKVVVRAGRVLHQTLFQKLLHSPMRYFETTPVGRILNMFARDLDEIENRLPPTLETMTQNIWVVVFAFLFITIVFPWFLLPLALLSGLYVYISRIFRVAVRDLQRVDNITRAPILSCVSATMQGLPTIHAFEKQHQFLTQFSTLFDENSTCLYMNCNAMRWMATRLDLISVIITCITALMAVVLKGQVPAALAGLALTYAAHISGVFQYTIRLMSETEQRFISVERMQNCARKLVPEGTGKSQQPPEEWPARGAIKFKDVVLSYGENLPDVLHSFSLSIRAGEKLGVVGRTGAGKSSLIVALFRLRELNEGSITVDGLDISGLDLDALRSAMAVIPQDPVLFNGSFRYNLDPFGKYSDDRLWEILKKTQLEQRVRGLEGGIEALVGEGGVNLSVGERQLVCLARALLRGTKILLLDEATASVDPETEQAIQATIHAEFVNCTVITIAHRLATVTSNDRILLMDHGMVVELDDPNVLLANRNSEFFKMAAAAGFIPS